MKKHRLRETKEGGGEKSELKNKKGCEGGDNDDHGMADAQK